MLTTSEPSHLMYCRHGVPTTVRGHDCGYTDLRESLVDDAEKYADETVGLRPPKIPSPPNGGTNNPEYERWSAAWNRVFFTYIDTKVRQLMQGRNAS
jgi:hypothetical protein